jgi:hypothetical protein
MMKRDRCLSSFGVVDISRDQENILVIIANVSTLTVIDLKLRKTY